jgi:hypothetical protein
MTCQEHEGLESKLDEILGVVNKLDKLLNNEDYSIDGKPGMISMVKTNTKFRKLFTLFMVLVCKAAIIAWIGFAVQGKDGNKKAAIIPKSKYEIAQAENGDPHRY